MLAGTEGSVDHNGQTDLFTTTFTVSGTLDEIDAHLSGIVANLTALPEQRIEVEKQILAAEEDGRSKGIFERLACVRYGATGIGLTDFPELGLSRLSAADLSQWAGQYFTADNAVLVVVGPQRPGRLPAGGPCPIPAPAAPTSRMPSFAFEPVSGPALIDEVTRSAASVAYASMVDRELMRRVRGELGLAYRASAGYVPISTDRAVVIAYNDAVSGQAQQAVDAFLDVLFALAADGPDAGTLADVVTAHAAALDDPRAAFGRAHRAAREILFGEPFLDLAQLRAEFEAVTPADVQAVAAEVLRSATLLLPPEARTIGRGGFRLVSPADTQPVTGQTFSLPTDAGDVPVDLIVGVAGVSRVRGDRTETIQFADAVALLRWPNGRRILVARSGDMIRIDPGVVDAPRLDLVEGVTGPERWIDMPGSDTPPPTTQEAAQIAAPVAGEVPLSRYQRFVVRPVRAILVALVTMVLFVVAWPLDAQGELVAPGGLLVLVLPIVVAAAENAWYARRARRRNAEKVALRAQQPQHSQNGANA